jgi:hypothetical protein
MDDLERFVNDTEPGTLARLLNLREQQDDPWSTNDLAQLLQHQLDQNLMSDLSSIAPGAAETVKSQFADVHKAPETYRQLFQYPSPPVRVLELGKEMAKASRKDNESPLPSEISEYLYYAFIAVALVRSSRVISSLSERELQRGIGWALRRTWGDRDIALLLNDAADGLEAH